MHSTNLPRAALISLLAASLAACSERTATPPDAGSGPAPTKPRKPAVDPAVADIPLDESRPDDPSRWPRRPAETPTQVTATYILVRYKGAKGAEHAKRSREDAERRARRLVAVARKKGESFAELARRFSEQPRPQRGVAVVLARGQLPPPADALAFGMGPGQVSDAVDTEAGYHVLMRLEDELFSSAHIIIQYKGAEKTPPAITRSREEARKIAERVHALASKEDANFAVLASRNSDSPSGRLRGGALRPMPWPDMPPAYANYLAAVRKLKIGEVSKVVETPFGFHIIKRLKYEPIAASHILISFTDSVNKPREERKRWDAETLARKVRAEAAAPNADFAALATKYSDDAKTSAKGGDLGTFALGIMPPRFEQIAFALRVGQVSDVVETAMGFHIIKRTK